MSFELWLVVRRQPYKGDTNNMYGKLMLVTCTMLLAAMALAPTASAHIDTELPSLYCPGSTGDKIDCYGGNVGGFLIDRTLLHQCNHLFGACEGLPLE